MAGQLGATVRKSILDRALQVAGPLAVPSVQRSAALADALQQLDENAGKNIRTPLALGSNLLAEALLTFAGNRENKRLQDLQTRSLQSETERAIALAGGGGGGQAASAGGSPAPMQPGPPAPPQAPPAGVDSTAVAPQPANPLQPPAAPATTPAARAGLADAVSMSPEDRGKLDRMVWGEARGEPVEGQTAAAAVALNRSKMSGKALGDILSEPGQFSGYNSAALGLPPNSPELAAIDRNLDPFLRGAVPDPTNGADHFYNPQLAHPAWGGAGQDIGNHRFMALGYGGQAPGPPGPPTTQGPTAQPPPPMPGGAGPPPGMMAAGDGQGPPMAPNGTRPAPLQVNTGGPEPKADHINNFPGPAQGVFDGQQGPPPAPPQGLPQGLPQGPAPGAPTSAFPGVTATPQELDLLRQLYSDPRRLDDARALALELQQRAARRPEFETHYDANTGQTIYTPKVPGSAPIQVAQTAQGWRAPPPAGYAYDPNGHLQPQWKNSAPVQLSPTAFGVQDPHGDWKVSEVPGLRGPLPQGTAVNPASGAIQRLPIDPQQTFKIPNANGLFVTGPDGSPVKVADDAFTPKDLSQMRENWRASDETKKAGEAIAAYNGLVTAIGNATKNNGVLDSAATDSFLRGINPGMGARNSTVSMVLTHLGWPQELEGAILKATGNGYMTPEVLRQMVGIVHDYASAHAGIAQSNAAADLKSLQPYGVKPEQLGETLPTFSPLPTAPWYTGRPAAGAQQGAPDPWATPEGKALQRANPNLAAEMKSRGINPPQMGAR